MVLWRSQADEIDALRAEVRTLRGEMASQQAALEEMDTLVERMVLCDSMAQMQFVLRRAALLNLDYLEAWRARNEATAAEISH